MKDIKLLNRYGDPYVLKAINDNTYFFDGSQSSYFGVTLNEDNSYNWIDPEGGPVLAVGNKLGDKTIKEITFSDGGYNLIVE